MTNICYKNILNKLYYKYILFYKNIIILYIKILKYYNINIL